MTEAPPRHRLVSVRIAASGARAAAARFPGALTAALVAAALLIIAIHKRETSELLLRVASVAALGIAWLFALELMAERARVTRRTSMAIHAGAVLALVGYSWLTRGDTTVTYAARTAQLALALHLFCAFAAFVGRAEPNGFWQFNQRLFVRFLESVLWGGVFFAGLAIALVRSRGRTRERSRARWST